MGSAHISDDVPIHGQGVSVGKTQSHRLMARAPSAWLVLIIEIKIDG